MATLTTAPDRGQPPHPLLRRAFQEFDDAGLPWLLLRGAHELDRPAGDVDLLASGRVGEMDAALSRAGFTRLVARGHGGHRFYFARDARSGSWLKLDVVTAVTFGPYQQWDFPVAAECLDRRIRVAGIPRPAPHDESWLLILHLVLDKGQVPQDRVDLAGLAADISSADDPIAVALDELAGRGTAGGLLDAIRTGRFDRIPGLATRIRRSLTARSPLRCRAREVTARALRRVASPALLGRTRRGPTVAVMGPDGSGKTTLLTSIARDYPGASAYVYMGLWSHGRWDRLVRPIPGGRLAQKLGRAIRSGTLARYHRIRGRLVLLDRVPFDTQLPGSVDSSVGGRITAWTAARTAPRPDLLLTLDAPGEVMFARKGEHSVEVLERWRQAYLDLARRVPGAVVLDAGRPADEVLDRAVTIVWQAATTGRPANPNLLTAAPPS